MADTPGRVCPLRYSYGPAAVANATERTAETLYVIGGLYGNLPALDAIEAMARAEPGPVTLCFNGDFNWFKSMHPSRQAVLYGCKLGEVSVDSVAVTYDTARGEEEFLRNWPRNSPAWLSYFSRIANGPEYQLQRSV